MIIELAFKPVFIFINFIVGLIPKADTVNSSVASGFYDFIRIGLEWFGAAPFIIILTSVLLWSVIEITWAIIEWVYIKIPGVN